MLQNSNRTFQWSKNCRSHPILPKLSSALQGGLAGRADAAATGCMLCANPLQCLQLFATLWTVAYQAPLSMAFSRQEYWSGLPCPPLGDLTCVSYISCIGSGFFTTSVGIGWWPLIPWAVVRGGIGQHALHQRVEEDSSPHLHITVFQLRRWDCWEKGWNVNNLVPNRILPNKLMTRIEESWLYLNPITFIKWF